MFATDGTFGTHDQNVGLDPDFTQLLYAVLSRLGLGFTRGFEIRDEREMNEHHILFADIQRDLANRFQKRQAFDVADGSAQFGDHNVDVGSCQFQDGRFDLIRDVRNNLNCSTEVFAAAFFFNHGQINLTGCVVGITIQNARGEAFVMAEVEVGFGAVIQHINFAVLKGTHGARIDVEVRIELLHADFQSAAFEQHTDGRRSQSLAQ